MNKQQLIKTLNLEPHQEGGFFRRTYNTANTITIEDGQQRSCMSSIYYLLTDDSPIGYFHRNRSDIIHYWHAGQSLTYFLINPVGELTSVILGPNIAAGEHLQLVVPGGYWKATHLENGEYGLLSEAVTPGFDYDDMQLAKAEMMQQQYPTLWPQLANFCK